MRLLLLAVLLSPAGAAEPPKVGCTPVEAERVAPEFFESALKPLAAGKGAEVAKLGIAPALAWDLGEKRAAKLGVYLTRECELGLRTYVTSGWESSSPDIQGAVDSFAALLRKHAPDWAFSVEPPNTIRMSRGETVYATDLRKLLQIRLDAGKDVVLGGRTVRAVFDGWLLFLVPPDGTKAVNLSVRSTVHPWAYYDLTPYGLPKLLARFDEDAAVLYPLP